MASVKKTNLAYDILKSYDGDNPYMLILRKQVYVERDTNVMNDFNIDFIVKNKDFSPKPINRVIKMADWWAEDKKIDWATEFLPNKLKVISYLGENDTSYMCYIQYRRSVPEILCSLPKKAVLTNFLVKDYKKMEVDFDRYDRLSDFKRVLYPHQKEAIKFLLTRKKCILADDMGLGKMEPVSSLIPTPNGYKKMGDIEAGDYVFGENGNPIKVLNTYPHKGKEIYKVTFSDGTFSYCGLEHLWKVTTKTRETRKQPWVVMSLEEMLKHGLQYNSASRENKGLKKVNKYKIPVCEPVEYSKKEYFIDPYILGICLGDGNMCNNGINISIPDFEIETSEKIKACLNEGYTLSINRSASCPRYRIIQDGKGRNNGYITEIKRLGLNVHGNNKFIPEEYKLGSIEQRISLLRGLMDSDGSIRNGNKIGYYTNSKQLAEDVSELVFSLGGIARISGYEREKNGKKRIEYHVRIQIKMNPFSLQRKAEKYSLTYKKYCVKYIVSAEFDHIEDAKCLMVDSDKHTYLTSKNYIVTHNTTAVSVAAIEGNFDSILIVCPASLKSNWKRELSFYVPDKDISVIDGFNDKTKPELEEFLGYAPGKSGLKRAELLEEAKTAGKWKFNRFVILNYDILDEFYKIPKGRSFAAWEETFEKSPLLQYITNRKTLIVIDEAHKLSSSTSNRYKVLKSLIKKGNPDSLYLITGTPLTNDPTNIYCVLSFLGDPITDDYKYYMERYCGAYQMVHPKDKEKRKHIVDRYFAKKGVISWKELYPDEREELEKEIESKCKMILVTNKEKIANLDELKDRISHIYLRRTKEDLTLPEKTIHEIYYDLNNEQWDEYERLWEEYEAEQKEENEDKELNKALIEGGLYRRYLSNQMVPYTEKLVDKLINKGEKVVIACCFDEEIYTLKDYYGDAAVLFNGKCSLKQKDAAVEAFMTDDNVKVFLGNIQSAGVGITLISSCKLVFNDMSYVPGDNQQMSDRVYRIGQTKPVDIYYQIFRDTQYEKMWNIVLRKNAIIDAVVKKEEDK